MGSAFSVFPFSFRTRTKNTECGAEMQNRGVPDRNTAAF